MCGEGLHCTAEDEVEAACRRVLINALDVYPFGAKEEPAVSRRAHRPVVSPEQLRLGKVGVREKVALVLGTREGNPHLPASSAQKVPEGHGRVPWEESQS